MGTWTRVRNSLLFLLVLSCVALAGCAGVRDHQGVSVAPAAEEAGCTEPNTAVADYFALIRSAPQELVKLMTLFPKGGDIHNHLAGTVRPEDYIAMGSDAGHCYDPLEYAITALPCTVANPPLSEASPAERQSLINSLSMHDFPYPNIQAGHDHFFAAFDKFGLVSGSMQGNMLGSLLRQAEAENVGYVETMLSLQSAAVASLAEKLRQRYPASGPYYTDSRSYLEMYNYLRSIGLVQVELAAKEELSGYVDQMRYLLGCGTSRSAPACAVSFRFLAEVNNRNADLPRMFTQTAFAFLLANNDPRVVGVNMVSDENLASSTQEFATQMAIFRSYHQWFTEVDIAIHAGEITPCFVGTNNPALKEHVTGAITAGAKRLGHGSSFAFLDERAKAEVVHLMQQQDTLVEILLTSNAQTLGLSGNDHPFPQYFRTNLLPSAFATDYEGVSYASYTDAWLFAVLQYQLSYEELMALARFSLQYSFLPGAPLWQEVRAAQAVAPCGGLVPGSSEITEECRDFLQQSEKATMQWWHEGELARFNQNYGDRLRQYLGSGRQQ